MKHTQVTKGVVRSYKSKDRQHNDHEKKGKKDKQRSTKHTHKIKHWLIIALDAYWNFFVTFSRHETHDNSHIGICTRTISRTCYFLFDILFGSSETILDMKVFFFIFAKAIISQCLILCVCFVDRCLSFFPFFHSTCLHFQYQKESLIYKFLLMRNHFIQISQKEYISRHAYVVCLMKPSRLTFRYWCIVYS
jgi:hypothetical protein